MKKYILLFSSTIAILTWLLLIPNFVHNSYLLVNSSMATSENIYKTIDCKGEIEAKVQDNIVSSVPIKITDCNYKVGDTVKKGDKLFNIDESFVKQTFSQIYNSTTATIPNLNSNSINPDDAINALKQAFSMGLIDQNTFDSLVSEFENKEISSNDFNDYIREYNTNNLAQSSSNFIENDTSDFDIEEALKSKINGTIISIKDPTNGVIPSSTSIATIADMNTLQVQAQVSEENIKDTIIGQKAYITGKGFYEKFFGKVLSISPSAKSSSSLTTPNNYINVTVSIDNPNENLKPGFSVNLSILQAEKPSAITIPFDFVKQNDDGSEYVYIFDKGRASKVDIQTGEEFNDKVEVISGVLDGDIVLTNSDDSIENNMKVRLK